MDDWQGHSSWRKKQHKQFFLVTDSSSVKYGAKILSGSFKGLTFGDFRMPDDNRPIRLKEVEAVLRSLQSLESQLQNIFIDI